jgi:hypothetical protein
VTVAAITAGVLLLGGALAIASAGMMGFVSFGPAMLAFSNSIKLTAALTKAWAAAQWLENAAMDANPIGLLIAGIAALAVGAYEVWKHWDKVKLLADEAYTWGKNLVTNIAKAIEDWAMIPVHAIEKLAGKMAWFVVGHSPIPEGPLHELNLGRQIALSLNPAPAMAAMRRLGMATMVAAPLMFGAGAGTAAASGGPSIVVNYSVTVAAGSPDEWVRAARKHGDEIVRIVEARLARRDRLSFNG